MAPLFSLSQYGAVFDAHAHSYFDLHDGRLSPAMFVKLSQRKGFNWVCGLTHDTTRGNHRLRAAAQAEHLPFLPAIEVSTCYNHILGYGVQEWRWAKDSWDPEIAIERLREQGCAVYASHPAATPLKTGGPWNNLVYELDFDGIEWINSIEVTHNPIVWKLLKNYPKGRIAGSDAHYTWTFGDAFTQVLTNSEDPDDIVAAMRKGKVSPHGRASNFLVVGAWIGREQLWKYSVGKIKVEGTWIKENWGKMGILPNAPFSGKEWRDDFLTRRGKKWDSVHRMVVIA
ncbi:MAG TPA: PHP-associated domain-containing protein [Candidatus Lokiarchaeia archaeon]|nr:PHP-associated domain-containing protein [Candidatus Lokiarchaeia archaeon]